jgi:hypothetical protein
MSHRTAVFIITAVRCDIGTTGPIRRQVENARSGPLPLGDQTMKANDRLDPMAAEAIRDDKGGNQVVFSVFRDADGTVWADAT